VEKVGMDGSTAGALDITLYRDDLQMMAHRQS
jgi:pyrimidine operon attenuation protein/uracil phosphoribosyltransferase